MLTMSTSGSGTSITQRFDAKDVRASYGDAGVAAAQKIIEVLNTHLPHCAIELGFKALDKQSPQARFTMASDESLDDTTIHQINDLFGEHFGGPEDGYKPVAMRSHDEVKIFLEPIEN